MRLFPSEPLMALKLSLGLWVLGAIAFSAALFFRIDVMAAIKIFLLLGPPAVFFLAKHYLRKANSSGNAVEGAAFGMFLVATQLPLDITFVFLFLKDELMLFQNTLVALVYAEMIFFSAMARVTGKK